MAAYYKLITGVHELVTKALRSPERVLHILVAAVGSVGEDIPPSSRTHGEDICLRSEPARKTFRIISGDVLSQGRYPHLPEEDIPNPNRLRTTGASCYSRGGQQLDLATAEDHSVDGLTQDKDPHILSEQFELSVVSLFFSSVKLRSCVIFVIYLL